MKKLTIKQLAEREGVSDAYIRQLMAKDQLIGRYGVKDIVREKEEIVSTRVYLVHKVIVKD